MGIQRRDISGNAGTATRLKTARNIGGVSFNGTADINLPGVNAPGNQPTSGNAATATASTTAPVSDASTAIATTEFVKRMFGGSLTNDGTDWNAIENTRPGFSPILKQGSDPNGPGGGIYFHVLNTTYAGLSGAENLTQLAIAYGAPGDQLWMRGRYNGTWSQWVQFAKTTDTAQSVTTAGALNATAGASAGAVGTYAFAHGVTGNPGTTAAGSSLSTSNRVGTWGPTLSGTWRCMGYADVSDRSTLWLRIA